MTLIIETYPYFTSMRSLRTLSVSKISSNQLQSEDFTEFGNELEDLKISQAELKSIAANAFKYVRGLKRLDLSENRISKIDDAAFQDLEHSLIALKMAHALSADYHSLSPNLFKSLSSLQYLDLSNNRIKSIPETSFHFMKNIKALEIRDNQIDQIAKGTFQGDIHSRLQIISFAFNAIKYISQHTFVDLSSLKQLNLDDNKIEKIERRGFMNLDQLKTLSLRGNRISSISDESFQVTSIERIFSFTFLYCVHLRPPFPFIRLLLPGIFEPPFLAPRPPPAAPPRPPPAPPPLGL